MLTREGVEAQQLLAGVLEQLADLRRGLAQALDEDRKSTRLNSSNSQISYAVFCFKKKIQGSKVPNPDEAVHSFVSGAMSKAGKGLLEGTLQAGTSSVSDKLLDLVGLGGKSAADKGKDTRY